MRHRTVDYVLVGMCLALAILIFICTELALRLRSDVEQLERYIRRLEQRVDREGGLEVDYK